MAKMVTITEKEYKSLEDTAAHMRELDARGVDNWGDYCGKYQSCDSCETDEINWDCENCPNCDERLGGDGY